MKVICKTVFRRTYFRVAIWPIDTQTRWNSTKNTHGTALSCFDVLLMLPVRISDPLQSYIVIFVSNIYHPRQPLLFFFSYSVITMFVHTHLIFVFSISSFKNSLISIKWIHFLLLVKQHFFGTVLVYRVLYWNSLRDTCITPLDNK